MTFSEELAHFGIKGMKWGVRKNRSASGGESSKSQSFLSKDEPTTSEWHRSRRFDHLSNKDLKARINRLEMEKKYRDLTMTKSERRRKAMKKAIGDILANTVKKQAQLVVDKQVSALMNGKISASLPKPPKMPKPVPKKEPLVSEGAKAAAKKAAESTAETARKVRDAARSARSSSRTPKFSQGRPGTRRRRTTYQNGNPTRMPRVPEGFMIRNADDMTEFLSHFDVSDLSKARFSAE
jgi:hypothetical protein